MPKSKSSSKQKPASRKSVRRSAQKTTERENRKPSASAQTEEYSDYLERYELYGEGRPRLSPSEFNRFDEELLDLLALQGDQGSLSDDEIIRLQELEYLLLDEQSDSVTF